MGKDTPGGQRALWLQPPHARAVRKFRADIKVSAAEFGRLLGEKARGHAYDRTTIKHLESRHRNGWKISQRIIRGWELLQKEFSRGPDTERIVIIFSKGTLPHAVHTLRKPRRCRGHRLYWFDFTTTQVYCNSKKECMKLWRQRKKKRRLRNDKSKNVLANAAYRSRTIGNHRRHARSKR
jgi:hypothetical protein